MGASPHTPLLAMEKGRRAVRRQKVGGDWFSGNSAPDGVGKRDKQKHAPPGNSVPNSAGGADRFHILIIRLGPLLNMGQGPIPHYFITAGKCGKKVRMASIHYASIC